MDLATAQREALERRASETGRYKDLLVYYAVLEDWNRFREIGAKAQHPEDALTYDVLALSDGVSSAANARSHIGASDDPFLYYSLAKHFLGLGDVGGALDVAKQLLSRKRDETIVLNLVAKYLAHQNDAAVALHVALSSLRINEDQHDMVALKDSIERNRPLLYESYLGVAPQNAGVSFYVPAYNAARYMRGTIEALIGQNYPLHEIIVVDDGSTDATVAIAREYPVRVIEFGENRGLAAARNAAFREATTPFVGAVDADVCADPDYTTHILMEFENADARLAGVGGRLIEMYSFTPADKWRTRHLPQGWYPVRTYFNTPPPVGSARDAKGIALFFLNGCNNVFRRDIVLGVGGYNETYRTNNEDGSMGVLLRSRGYHLAFTHSAVARHARRDTIPSVLKTSWSYGFWPFREDGLYDDTGTILRHLERGKNTAYFAMNHDIAGGEIDCVYVGFLLLFYYPFLDIRFGVDEGFFTHEQGACIQQEILKTLHVLDERCGGSLFDRVYHDTAHLLIDATYRNESLTPDMRSLLDTFLDQLRHDFAEYPENLYGVLTGTLG